jgi:glutamate carboxypeptidase
MFKISQFLFIFFPAICLANAEVDLLKRLVMIESGSKQIDKVNEVQAILKSELTRLGFTTKQIAPPDGIKTGDLLVSTLKGASQQTITFLVHADTVFEPSSGFSGFNISSDGSIAKGPGVIDDKGGMVVLIFGLQEYLKTGIPKYTLKVVSSPSEEIGSPGFEEQFQAFSKDSILVLGFEPSLDNKNIISSRKGNAWFQIDVEGRETHAGRAHKEGINACVELAEKITQISKLTNYQKNTTVNVGHIEGGQDKYNIVCGNASAKIDTRFETLEEQGLIKRKISEILKSPQVYSVNDHVPSKITFNISSESPPFAKGPHNRYLIKYIAAVEAAEGKSIGDEQSGGSADSNSFSRKDLPIIDGLGPSGGKMHTKDELIYLPSLQTRSRALTLFLKGL